MAKIWKEVVVEYHQNLHWWQVWGCLADGSRDHLASSQFKMEAIEEARLYAFDTSCGPTRAHSVKVLTKAGKLQKFIIEG
tara:strand:- start:1341 stop:1580 length:240 start_codon:yes stop_codon:yes gene_type:complete